MNAAARALAPKKWGRAVWTLPPAATPIPGSAGDSRLMGDAPDRSVTVFGHEERTIFCDRNADRAAPDLLVGKMMLSCYAGMDDVRQP